jgi:hypothetical protein
MILGQSSLSKVCCTPAAPCCLDLGGIKRLDLSAIFTTGAKAYFMRMIMHDYADPVCVDILSHLARAMSLNSRVLVCDMVLPQRVGEADFPAAVLDQAVMTMGGKERTEAGFKSILESAGIELVQVWRVPGVPGACVEGRLKR